MTPTLQALQGEAEKLGLSPDSQKGLLFIELLFLMFSGMPKDEMLSAMVQLSPLLVDMPSDRIKYDDVLVAELLMERSLRLMPGLGSPEMSEGFPQPSRQRLPDDRGEAYSYANSDRIATSLMRQIGEAIEGDVESAYLCAYHFQDKYTKINQFVTATACRGAFMVSTPHLRWLFRCPFGSSDPAFQADTMARVLDWLYIDDRAFAGDELTIKFIFLFNRQLHSDGDGGQTNLREFREVALAAACSFARLPIVIEELPHVIPGFRELQFETPPNRLSFTEALEYLDRAVLERTGYDLNEEGLTFGETLTRKCHVLSMAIASAVLNPDWVASPPPYEISSGLAIRSN